MNISSCQPGYLLKSGDKIKMLKLIIEIFRKQGKKGDKKSEEISNKIVDTSKKHSTKLTRNFNFMECIINQENINVYSL